MEGYSERIAPPDVSTVQQKQLAIYIHDVTCESACKIICDEGCDGHNKQQHRRDDHL